MLTPRRSAPYVLLSILTGFAILGVALGLTFAPTSQEVSLRSAAEVTAQVPSLRFVAHVPAGTTNELGKAVRLSSEEVVGTWQAPDRWQTTISGGPNDRRTVTLIGSYVYIKNPGQPVGRLLTLPYKTAPFELPYGYFGLPPIAAIATATAVVQHGDTYRFVIPDLAIPPQFIAYAPLSGAQNVPPESFAHDVPAIADVVDGYVVTYSFPDGVMDGHQHLRGASWALSEFGKAPPVLAPRLRRT